MSWIVAAEAKLRPQAVKALALSVLPGAALALTLPRPGISLLAWFCLAPLIALWSGARPKAAFLSGWLAGAAFHGLAFHWIYSTCRFAGMSIPLSGLAWFSLSAALGLQWGLIAALGRWALVAAPESLRPWGWAALWTALMVSAERWTPRLCADLLAYTQYKNPSLIQIGSLAGPHALGFLIVAFNAALVEAWTCSRRRSLVLACLLVSGAWLFGAYELTSQRMKEEEGSLAKIEILQPAIDQYQKWAPGLEKDILANFSELLSRRRQEPPHLVIWPESALPYWVDEKSGLPEISHWSRRLSAFQLVGVVSRLGEHAFNSAALVASDGRLRGLYHKRRLVPFGEFVPMGFLRRYIGILNELGGITPGESVQPLLETPLGLAAASICYEAVFPALGRLDASRGARWLINITNDGWYRDTWGPYQHFYVNVFRAVENRVYVLRAGNTGISGVIDPWGGVAARLDLGRRGRLEAWVPLEDPFPRRSFYARHGDWFGSLCLLAALGLAALPLVRRP
ncbi:MAG: apolipoprotein N-acyltransferase [Elusimicrobia bacterium]|nr:apolipoprotein N-acyltransferase [Elusimicrobiota bacterium]